MTLPVENTRFQHLARLDATTVRNNLMSFVEFSTVATNRASYYNNKEELNVAFNESHRKLFEMDRGLYAAVLMMGGVTDFTRQAGLFFLLNRPFASSSESCLTAEHEMQAIKYVINQMPPQRVFKVMEVMKKAHINNNRTRNAFLSYFLDSSKCAFWSIKYRSKVRTLLQHCWGTGTYNSIRMSLATPPAARTVQQQKTLRKNIAGYLSKDADPTAAYEAVHFVTCGSYKNVNRPYSVPILQARIEALTDVTKLKLLPLEVAEGIRARLYGDKLSAVELIDQINKTGKLSQKQTKNVQQRVKKANEQRSPGKQVNVEFDPMSTVHDLSEVLIYAYAQGMTEQIREAIQVRAEQIAGSLQMRNERVVVIIDGSNSMIGDDTNLYKPIATAMAIGSVLKRTGLSVGEIVFAGGLLNDDGLVEPEGSTNIASAIVDALDKHDPNVVYIISDGYENVAAGRVDQVCRLAQKINGNLSFVHVNPVASAEAKGTRPMSSACMTTLAAHNTNSLIATSNKLLLETNIVQYLENLIQQQTLPKLLPSGQ